jgi:hypothetical protein
MKKLMIVVACLFSAMLLVTPPDIHAAGPVTAPGKIETGKIPKVKPTLPTSADTRDKAARKKKKDEKTRPVIAFKEASVWRNASGLHHWQVRIKALINRQVPAKTAMVEVIQNAGGKSIHLDTRTYGQPINPGYGLMNGMFTPSGTSDTLKFRLIQLEPRSDGLSAKPDSKNVVDRATASVPDFGVRMYQAGYQFIKDPHYLYANLSKSSPWPLRVRVVMRAGRYDAWTTVRHSEVAVVKPGTDTKIKKEWAFNKKGGGKFKIDTEARLLDPATGKTAWVPIIEETGLLPTY